MATVFTVPFTLVAIAAQQDVFSWKALDDAPLTLIGCVIANTGIAADVGDAAEQDWCVEICRGNTTIGSGGTNPTGRPVRTKDTTTLPTTNLRANDTTKISGGTRVLLLADGFNTRTGWQFTPTPEQWITSDEGDGFTAIQLTTTPSNSITMSGTLWLRQE